ncbi:MAG: type II toxin-antitoxin system VapC family toxin [Pseudomonadota bacterium]
MKSSVYIESSVISYLTARPSRDVVKSARQAITIEWWQSSKVEFDVFISVLVRKEIAAGDAVAAAQRLAIVQDTFVLGISSEAERIADALITEKALPENSQEDALHIGIATSHGMDYLLTWNFKHINNAKKKLHVMQQFPVYG